MKFDVKCVGECRNRFLVAGNKVGSPIWLVGGLPISSCIKCGGKVIVTNTTGCAIVKEEQRSERRPV